MIKTTFTTNNLTFDDLTEHTIFIRDITENDDLYLVLFDRFNNSNAINLSAGGRHVYFNGYEKVKVVTSLQIETTTLITNDEVYTKWLSNQ